MAQRSEAIFDDKEIQQFFDTLKRKNVSIEQGSRQLAGIISANVFRDLLGHFEREESPGGRAWQAWSEIYAEHMEKKGKGGNKILQDTGRLRQSFTPTSYRVVTGGIVFYNSAKTNSGFPYADAHNTGGSKLPQREFMWLSDIAMEEISDSTLNWLLEDA